MANLSGLLGMNIMNLQRLFKGVLFIYIQYIESPSIKCVWQLLATHQTFFEYGQMDLYQALHSVFPFHQIAKTFCFPELIPAHCVQK